MYHLKDRHFNFSLSNFLLLISPNSMLRSLGDFRLIKIKKALEISIIMAQQFLYFDDEGCGFYNFQSI